MHGARVSLCVAVSVGGVASVSVQYAQGRGEGTYGRGDGDDALRSGRSQSPAHGREAVGVFFVPGRENVMAPLSAVVCSGIIVSSGPKG